MEEVVQAQQQVEEKSTEIDRFISGSIVVRVETPEQYAHAVTVAKAVKSKAKEMEEMRKSIVKPINDSVSKINAMFKPLIEKLTQFETGIKNTCATYAAEQERKRIEEQRLRNEEIRKERERIEAAAREKRRKEEQAREEEEKARREAMEAEDAKERERLERLAEKKRQEAEKASAAADAQESIAETVVAPTKQKPLKKAGVYTVDKFEVKVQDAKKFIEWVVKTEMWEYLIVNESLLNKEAANTKGARQWPGIKVIKSQTAKMRG